MRWTEWQQEQCSSIKTTNVYSFTIQFCDEQCNVHRVVFDISASSFKHADRNSARCWSARGPTYRK
eukprot:jgi/Antlo1/1111/2129